VADLEVFVVTPERALWSGPAELVIARGTEGEVGILRGHAPMLIRLAVAPIRIRTGERDVRAVVDGGFLHVSTEGDVTRVDVLADGAQLAEEVDVAAAERDRAAARERLEADRDDEAARAALARAEARLALSEPG